MSHEDVNLHVGRRQERKTFTEVFSPNQNKLWMIPHGGVPEKLESPIKGESADIERINEKSP
jgi:hypothetical protein